jgi:hypothetical protein
MMFKEIVDSVGWWTNCHHKSSPGSTKCSGELRIKNACPAFNFQIYLTTNSRNRAVNSIKLGQ